MNAHLKDIYRLMLDPKHVAQTRITNAGKRMVHIREKQTNQLVAKYCFDPNTGKVIYCLSVHSRPYMLHQGSNYVNFHINYQGG